MANCKLKIENSRATREAGFTLVELIITMTIFATLLGLVTFSLLNAQHSASLNQSVDTLVSDVHQQQLRAMDGDTGGRGAASSYGISFGTNSYTLFYGSNPHNDASDLTVALPGTMQFASGTSGTTMVFTQGSGETTAASLVLKDTTNNSQKHITINKLGVVTGD